MVTAARQQDDDAAKLLRLFPLLSPLGRFFFIVLFFWAQEYDEILSNFFFLNLKSFAYSPLFASTSLRAVRQLRKIFFVSKSLSYFLFFLPPLRSCVTVFFGAA